MESAFGVDHGEISKKLGSTLIPKAPGRHAMKSAAITGNHGEVPNLPRGLRGQAPRHRKPGEPVTKAFSTGASSKIVGQLGRSKKPGDKVVATQMIRQGIKYAPKTTGARERALSSGAVRAERLGARIRHRENYPGSKKLKGFPQRQLP